AADDDDVGVGGLRRLRKLRMIKRVHDGVCGTRAFRKATFRRNICDALSFRTIADASEIIPLRRFPCAFA
ncbi:MAG TPA: hypothetical protein VGY52_11900, partial [Roseiarcus sp.]|nr:hypothetical protein [Roseiarcus sp.]